MGPEAALNACPWWLVLLAGFGLGAMTRQSLRRGVWLLRGDRPQSAE